MCMYAGFHPGYNHLSKLDYVVLCCSDSMPKGCKSFEDGEAKEVIHHCHH